jgi:hypothetical protein
MAGIAQTKSGAYSYFFDQLSEVGRETATGGILGPKSAQSAQLAPNFQ